MDIYHSISMIMCMQKCIRSQIKINKKNKQEESNWDYRKTNKKTPSRNALMIYLHMPHILVFINL